MNKIFKNTLIILMFIGLVCGCLISNTASAYAPTELYDTVWKLVNRKFVDQTNNNQDWNKWRHKYDNYIKTDEDAYLAISTMVASLNDPYTRFLDPKEFAAESSDIKGSLKGIGTQIGIKDGKLTIIAPIENSPAERAGLLADDEILEINGDSTKGITIDKAADKIRGEAGTTVKLIIKRGTEVKTYVVTREEIEIKYISTKPQMPTTIPNNIAYIKLSSFISKNAANEFHDIIEKNATKDGYILDLRSNPGGLLTNAVAISNMLLKNCIIVSTVDRDCYKDTQRADFYTLTNKPMVVLVNKGSASASEILSGALKDNKRAIIVGEQSFGKGIVQEINKLPQGSAVHITIQKYLTPKGTDIHKKGITPDVIVKLTENDIKNKNDVQLKKGIEVLEKVIASCK